MQRKENETLYDSHAQRELRGRVANVGESVDEFGTSKWELNSRFSNYLNPSGTNLAVIVR